MITKRTTAPVFWPVERKTKKFIVSTMPGPHPKDRSMPLGVVLRDEMHCAETLKEAKTILKRGLVKVDGKQRNDYRFPVGVMDVLSVGDGQYRILPDKKGLYLKKIDGKEAGMKLLKIKNKTCVKGKIQINFYDGKNAIINSNDYATGDTLVFDLASGKILQHIKMKKGSIALITEGKNRSVVGKIEDITTTFGSEPNRVIIQSTEKRLMVPKDYVFVIGEDKPVIALGAE